MNSSTLQHRLVRLTSPRPSHHDPYRCHSAHCYTSCPYPQPSRSAEDSGFPSALHTYPVGSSHGIVALWETRLKARVLSLVRRKGDEWRAVEVFRRGWDDRREEQCPVTVLISLEEGSCVEGWVGVVWAVKKLCVEVLGEVDREDELEEGEEVAEGEEVQEVDGFEVEVDVVVAGVVRAGGEGQLGMGKSIGVDGDVALEGTMGGYLELWRDGGMRKVGMTCHHVLSRGKDAILPTAWKPHAIEVSHPSVTENESSLQGSLAWNRMFLERYQDSRDEEFRERYLGKIQRDELSLSEVRTRDRKLGRAFATSGLKVTRSGWSLDWGLVLLNDGHSVVNEPLNDSRYDRRPSVYFTDVDDFTTLEPGCTIHKGGAVSGWSRGRINEIRSQVRLPGGPPEGTTECCSVGGDRAYPFSRNGDSGAWVTSITGRLCGLLVGCHTAGGWGYVTPIQDVMEDIEISLGCEVVLPGELGSRYRYG